MLRLIWDRPAREALRIEAGKLVETRMGQLAMLSDEELSRQVAVTDERHTLMGVRVRCCSFHEQVGEAERRFVVQVWGAGFVAGGWLLAAEGFALKNGQREPL